MYFSPAVIVGMHVVGVHKYQSSVFELVDQELFTLTLGTCLRVTVVILCVCVSVCLCVCYHANCSTYVPPFFHRNSGVIRLSVLFQRIHCVDFAETLCSKCSGDICWSPLPSSLLGLLFVDKRDSDGIFSSRLVCRTSDSSYNSTDWSLVTVDCQNCWSCMSGIHVHTHMHGMLGHHRQLHN